MPRQQPLDTNTANRTVDDPRRAPGDRGASDGSSPSDRAGDHPGARRFDIIGLAVGERELGIESATLVLRRDEDTPGAHGPTTWAIDFRARDPQPLGSGEQQVVARLADGRELHADATLRSTGEGSYRLDSIGGFGGMEEW